MACIFLILLSLTDYLFQSVDLIDLLIVICVASERFLLLDTIGQKLVENLNGLLTVKVFKFALEDLMDFILFFTDYLSNLLILSEL